MTKRTHGAHAVVTGAGSGIGKAIAAELVRRGSRVICADIDLASAERTVTELKSQGGEAVAVACDVSTVDEVGELANQARSWLGRDPDLVVNNAGIGAGGKLVGESPLSDWRRTLGVNLWGVIHGCHTFVPAMRAAKAGGVINVASAAGFTAAPRMAAYNVSKAGVVSLSETLAAELSGKGVAVTVLCPTFVRTNIFGGELIDAEARGLAQRVSDLVGFSPERVAKMTLDAHDRGRLYVVPQPDAQLLWHAKRFVPVPYTRIAGLLGRFLPAEKEK
ncbi:SDR family NAD(P)-dependent oxidoreductase [Amycolatopsis regifaucium]|uniref:Short-chain dehydrogenase n=1 Tax=Amycolatopsis regifaucium TaxID=546365 RepID=A0A154MGN9_9PSEU|nr:SDR family NAD(P)-dependent oxidoreductase [Amycolatopsis regifaucium]KZB83320.1 short-chain dehydrogenase [Amycolatopsis regifaucium]OKA08786.1 short-chain dehydrogenase [Amycolatopsis regifaucium]SFI94967.1 Short-chain dehydrogenase [Amycolatopsis regifaucium]